MRSSPQPTAFNLRRMCCWSLRGLGGAFQRADLAWSTKRASIILRRRIFIQSS